MGELINWIIKTELVLILALIFILVIKELREGKYLPPPEKKTHGFREVRERIEW